MFRRRYGRLSLLLGFALLALRRAAFARPLGLRGLARDFIFLRFPIFTPTGIALRAVSRLFRRFRI